jgi:hypothetical protein
VDIFSARFFWRPLNPTSEKFFISKLKYKTVLANPHIFRVSPACIALRAAEQEFKKLNCGICANSA